MKKLATSVRCVAPVGAILGEGPIFDPRIGKLLFLDIKGERIFVYDPESEAVKSILAPGQISALGLRAAGGYVCASRNGFGFLDLEDGIARLQLTTDPESDLPGNRFNDGKVDSFGGFWAGTMDDMEKDANAGSWWRLAPDGAVRLVDKNFHVTNGPAFDVARKRAYLTDSARRTVYVASYDQGGVWEKKVFIEFGDGDGFPDGMEVDSEGGLWIAFWDGGAVRRYSCEGELLESVDIPAPRTTSLAFAGDRMFVTSARRGLSDDALAQAPKSGGLFEVRLKKNISTKTRYFER